jgi:DnaJ-class molecular chaperone
VTVCDWCDGTGFISQGLGAETCPNCLGTGEIDGEESLGEEEDADEEF